jgi:HEPN domain-containing protein
MRRSPQDESQRWFHQAVHDLDDARYNLDGNRFNVACFLAQQAAEKFLKAYLYANTEEEIWGHSIHELCSDVAAINSEFSNLCERWRTLDQYYIATRYPDSLPGGIPSEVFNVEDAQRAVSIAESIAAEIQNRLTE